MRWHQKLKPYVRLANGREKSASFRVAFRLAFFQDLGKPFYVMVQRGEPNLVVDCGASKRDVKRTPLLVRYGRQSFRTWANWFRKRKGGAT